MVRNYKSKTNRASIDENIMKNAIQEVLSKKVSERVAARNFNIKRGILHSRRQKLKQKYSSEEISKLYNDYSGNESDEQDNAPIYSSKYSVCQTDRIDWLKSFMKRNKDKITLRKPESTSLVRATVVKKYKLKPEQIFNVDETGVQTILKLVKIVSTKGKKQVSLAASAERDELTKNTPSCEYLINAPTSSIALGNHSGWMTSELFLNVLEHIQRQTNCSKESKVLLLLDNYKSHTTVIAINFCRENGIILLSFPPHTSHKLQPLDVVVFGPFKTYLSVAFNDWMTSNPGKVITIKQIAQLTKIAFQAALTQKNITKSFEKPGLWPVNRLAFKEEEFAASYVNVSNNEIIEHESIVANQCPTHTDTPLSPPGSSSTHADIPSIPTITPSTSHTPLTPPKISNIIDSNQGCVKEQKNGKNNRGKSRVYTDTPEKNRLEELERERESRMRKQKERQRQRVMKQIFPEHNKKSKIVSRENRNLSTSSSYTDRSLVFESDNLSDEFSEQENTIELLQDDDIINENDFLLVKFPVKSNII
ncbi:hypothetical protein NQ314_008451 [Rhamnusium bicolor]|uniref:DDE-1 domain-containing protein n=1 Tax=Rhamnusium bicolor TaxID=1586634 RepID=A0AAV8YCW4_9CUCU|nr:hypothetical protein NQ314_008451 [Rhamnusium bicolor]